MIWSFDTIDAAADEIHDTGRAVDFSIPVPRRAGVPSHVPPGTGYLGRMA